MHQPQKISSNRVEPLVHCQDDVSESIELEFVSEINPNSKSTTVIELSDNAFSHPVNKE